MKARAIICDVYGTLMEVGPGPSDVEARWEALCTRVLGRPASRLWAAHVDALRAEVLRARSASQARGVAVPEVVWADIVGGVLPELKALPPSARDAFLVEQAALTHAVRLFPGTEICLERWQADGVLLGIASNAQPYSEVELEQTLEPAGLSSTLFDPSLCFWSWRFGFSKPDAHVFQILDARLRRHGIPPEAVLMVGDRMDNDLKPAREWGWQTWHLSRSPQQQPGGDWAALAAWWEGRDGR